MYSGFSLTYSKGPSSDSREPPNNRLASEVKQYNIQTTKIDDQPHTDRTACNVLSSHGDSLCDLSF